jgi:hypothetical protein
VLSSGPHGAWSRLERGELRLDAFYAAFDRDCENAGCRISAEALMALVTSSTVPRPAMIAAIARIRARGLLAAAVTNNWITEDEGTGVLRSHFDAFIESAVTGVRKPDPRSSKSRARLGIEPGRPCCWTTSARISRRRAMGMTTIKVVDPEAALTGSRACWGSLSGVIEVAVPGRLLGPSAVSTVVGDGNADAGLRRR